MNDFQRTLSSKLTLRSFFSPRHVIVFTVAFGITAMSSLTYVFSRPEIYQSSAKFLTSTGTEQNSASEQILLAQKLLEETLRRIKISRPDIQLDVSRLRSMLVVKPALAAHLMEMQAEGEDANLLPLLINTWIDVYLDAQIADLSKSKSDVVTQVKLALGDLEKKIEAARAARDQFERDQAVKSAVSEQNETKARIKGLISSYSNASEEEIKAKAQLDAINEAIANGEIVAPPHDNPIIINLQQRLRNLKEKLAEHDSSNDRANLALQPSLKMIPEEIKKLESEIEAQRLVSIKMVRANAERRYFTARQISNTLRYQLAEQKQLLDNYTNVLAQNDKLQRAVEVLEKNYRDYQEQLVRIETQQHEKYPVITVVARALQPREPIRPNYSSDVWLALLGSFLFGLLSVWVNRFVSGHAASRPELTVFEYNPHDHKSKDLAPGLSRTPSQPKPQIPENQKTRQTPAIRELSHNELRTLLICANSMSKQLISLLLCGLSLEEVSHLTPKDFNKHARSVHINGASPRDIALPSGLSVFFEQFGQFPVWYTGQAFSPADLSAWLILTAIDSGIANPEEISPLCFRHAYIIHLLRKGLRLGELEKIVGYLKPSLLLSYADYALPGAGRLVSEIDKFHPVLIECFTEKK